MKSKQQKPTMAKTSTVILPDLGGAVASDNASDNNSDSAPPPATATNNVGPSNSSSVDFPSPGVAHDDEFDGEYDDDNGKEVEEKEVIEVHAVVQNKHSCASSIQQARRNGDIAEAKPPTHKNKENYYDPIYGKDDGHDTIVGISGISNSHFNSKDENSFLQELPSDKNDFAPTKQV